MKKPWSIHSVPVFRRGTPKHVRGLDFCVVRLIGEIHLPRSEISSLVIFGKPVKCPKIILGKPNAINWLVVYLPL